MPAEAILERKFGCWEELKFSYAKLENYVWIPSEKTNIKERLCKFRIAKSFEIAANSLNDRREF